MRFRLGRVKRLGPVLLLGGLALAVALQSSCTDSYILAEGPNGDATLFSDFPIGDARRDLARGLLVGWQETPVRPERAFKIEVADSTGFRVRRNWRNIVYLADMRTHTWSAVQARKLLTDAAYRQLVSGPAGHAFAANAYAEGQSILVLHAADPAAFEQWISARGQEVLGAYFDLVIAGLQKTLYGSGEQKQMAAGIERRHGFRLRIPADFFVEEQTENRYVRIKQVMPSGAVMYLYVYYQDQAGDVVTAPYCVALRDTLASIYSSGDRVEPRRTTSRTIDFLGRPAVEVYGLYQNLNPPMGGPFKSICFRDGGRVYLIDMSVFNPPGEKMPQMRILEAIARTFTCEHIT